MPHWLSVLLIVAGSLTTLFGFGAALWRYVIKPLALGYGKLLHLLEQIRDASGGVQKLAREVEGLAGSVANFVVGILEEVRQHSERLERLEEMRELVVDIEAAVRRLERGHKD